MKDNKWNKRKIKKRIIKLTELFLAADNVSTVAIEIYMKYFEFINSDTRDTVCNKELRFGDFSDIDELIVREESKLQSSTGTSIRLRSILLYSYEYEIALLDNKYNYNNLEQIKNIIRTLNIRCSDDVELLLKLQ